MSEEELAPYKRALEAAGQMLADNVAGGREAWSAAEAAFQEVQLEALRKWPYIYEGGEVPMVGDVIFSLSSNEEAVVVALEFPMIRVGDALMVSLRNLAEALGAEVAPEMGQRVPQDCRLIRRTLSVPES